MKSLDSNLLVMDGILFASIFNLAHYRAWSDSFIIFFAAYWEYAVVAVFLVYLWQPKSRRAELKERAKKVAASIFSALVARYGIVEIIRYFYPRQRPFVLDGLSLLIKQNPLESSFPSGHATFFMALAVYFLLSGNKKLGWFLFFSAVVIGVARVAAGVHWPSDVMAGWAIGAAVSWLVFKLVNKKSLE